MNELLNRIYYDVESGYGGENKLYLKTKAEMPNIKRDDVKAFLKEQPIHQQYFQAKKSKNSFIVDKPLVEFQIDITYIEDSFSTSYHYVLTCVDVFSKIGDAEILKDKSGSSALDGMKKIMKRMGKPQQIYADRGKEFSNSEFQDYMDEEGIELILVRRHAPFVERFNKTFKTMMYKVMNDKEKGFSKWREYVPLVIKNYNNSYHRTIGMTPNEAVNNEEKVFEQLGLKGSVGKPVYDVKVGDKVRILLRKGDFARGYKPAYGKKVYVVEDVDDEKVLIGGDWVYKYDVKVFSGVEEGGEEGEGAQVGKRISQQRKLKRAGIKAADVVETPRVRKANPKYL